MIDVKLWILLICFVLIKNVAMEYESLEEDNTLRIQPDHVRHPYEPISFREPVHPRRNFDHPFAPDFESTTGEDEMFESPSGNVIVTPNLFPWTTQAPEAYPTRSAPDWWMDLFKSTQEPRPTTLAPIKWKIILPLPPHAKTTTTTTEESDELQFDQSSSSTTSDIEWHHHEHHNPTRRVFAHWPTSTPAKRIEPTTASNGNTDDECRTSVADGRSSSKRCGSQRTGTTVNRDGHESKMNHNSTRVEILKHSGGHDSYGSSAQSGIPELSFSKMFLIIASVLKIQELFHRT